MKQQTYVSSTPGSSLDLEWEHEGNFITSLCFPCLACLQVLHEYVVHGQVFAGMPPPIVDDDRGETEDSPTSVNNSQPSSLTASPWSRVSSPNSLEWDPVEPDMVCVDMDTEQLLTEIERLTDRALKETGEWTSTDS